MTLFSGAVFDILRLHSNLCELDLYDLNIDEMHGPIDTIPGGGPRVIQMNYIRASIALAVTQLSQNLRSLALGKVLQPTVNELSHLPERLELPCLEELDLFANEDSPLYGVVVSSATATLRQLYVRWLHTSVLNALVTYGSRNVITDLNIDGNLTFGSNGIAVEEATRAFVGACPRLRHLSVLCPWLDFFTTLDALVSPLLSILVVFSGRYHNAFPLDVATHLFGPQASSNLRRLRNLRFSHDMHKKYFLRSACERRGVCLAGARLEQFFERRVKRC